MTQVHGGEHGWVAINGILVHHSDFKVYTRDGHLRLVVTWNPRNHIEAIWDFRDVQFFINDPEADGSILYNFVVSNSYDRVLTGNLHDLHEIRLEAVVELQSIS